MDSLSAAAREWLEDELALDMCSMLDRGIERVFIARFFRVPLDYVDDLAREIGDKTQGA